MSANGQAKTVREYQPGDRIDAVLHVREASLATTRTGKSYIRARLGDASGDIEAIQWDAAEESVANFPAGGYVRLRAIAESYKGSVNLKVEKARPADPAEVDPAAFVPTTRRDVAELQKELRKLVRSVKHERLLALLKFFFEDNGFMERLVRAPGATTYHHACAGGLLEHTVGVAAAADALAAVNDRIDRDLLVAGALLHDIGKMDELSSSVGFERTDAGNLVGHVVLGALAVDRAIRGMEGFPAALHLEVLHLLLAHHGQKEYGSPVVPATREALALHHLDNLDAKVEAADAAIRAPGQADARWTEYLKMLDGRIYRRPAEGGAR